MLSTYKIIENGQMGSPLHRGQVIYALKEKFPNIKPCLFSVNIQLFRTYDNFIKTSTMDGIKYQFICDDEIVDVSMFAYELKEALFLDITYINHQMK